ncbi:MAG: hypothetical protein WC449_04715 [Candidatus Paceibacterota bacterium]
MDRMRFVLNVPETQPAKVNDVYEFKQRKLPKWLYRVIMFIVKKYGKQYYEGERTTITEFRCKDFLTALFAQDTAITRATFQRTKYILIGREQYYKIFNELVNYPMTINCNLCDMKELYGKKVVVVPWMKEDFVLLSEEMLNG